MKNPHKVSISQNLVSFFFPRSVKGKSPPNVNQKAGYGEAFTPRRMQRPYACVFASDLSRFRPKKKDEISLYNRDELWLIIL